ncbi:MAG: RecQ family ATP-dependent DNA helicase [Alistipes sp.]|nr:RecQ family ATP-dependent DNA helicase [Alistipes sp.]
MKQAQTIHSVLRQHWGFDSFRPMQEQIIRSVMEGRDTLALMPTGGGKSLTYQVPAMAQEGICIVITPLIALMKDQVDNLRRREISAIAIHSGMTPRQIDIALDNCVYGDVKFLYIAPERLATEVFRLRVQKMKVSLLAVDEAHCISQWGYDFRPSYLRIAEVRRLIPDTPILALTASATKVVEEDIIDKLSLADPAILRSSFTRDNLSYSVRAVDDKNDQLMRIIGNVAGSGIVYVRTREGAEKIASWLREQGESADYYHGGLPNAERSLRQEDWTQGRTRIMVATNAFGMGIDKADVRFVVHYTMCDSLESYYQEAGRAGRDGKRSYAVLLTSPDDEQRVVKRFESEFPPLSEIKSIYEKVCNYVGVAIGDGLQSSFLFNIHDFATREHIFTGKIQSALKILQQNGYLTLTEEMENPARIMFCVSRDDLYKIRVERNDLDHFLRTILRMYNGVFTEFRAIDENEIASVSGYTLERVKELFKRLWQMRIIRYVPSNRSPILFFDEERLPVDDIYIAPETYRLRKEMIHERFSKMLSYASNQEHCRSRILAEYFGDSEAGDCGICDICLAKRKRQKAESFSGDFKAEIIKLLSERNLSAREIVAEFRCDPQPLLDTLKQMHEEGSIRTDSAGVIHKIKP